jgi:three-Cys-motif partner protein
VSPKRSTTRGGKAHAFGGEWTSRKLDVLTKYLAAYTKALKDQPFRKAYIDAFAGTGYRTQRVERSSSSDLLFPDLAEPAPQALLDGSARMALKVTPRFDRYIFIDSSQDRCAQLETLKEEFPDLAGDITIRTTDANLEIQKLCAMNWKSHRAVLFLDPYGMQVEWQTVAAVASTKAIDMWLLFPLGIGVNRLLTKSGDISDSWRSRLDKLLGTADWYDEFYAVEPTPTLFGTDEQRVIKAATETIGRYFNQRLKSVFAGVSENPAVLRNSKNCPLYLLCFAAGNAKGAPIAIRIADNLLEGVV